MNDNLDAITHRFEEMGINSRGQIYLAWLDKRDALVAKNRGEKYTGIAFYYAMSDDEGASFHANTRVADHTCECCRVAMAIDQADIPVIVWRHIFGKNVRDHGLARLDGPALSISGDAYHMAWFNHAAERSGLFYAHSADAGKTFSNPISVGNGARQAWHAAVLNKGDQVYLAWKEFDGEVSVINAMVSRDSGASWGGGAENSRDARYVRLSPAGRK